MRVADEIQPGDAQSLFVHCVVIQRIVIRDMRHADEGKMPLHYAHVAKFKPEISRRDGDRFAVGKLVVERAAEIKIFCFISCCCTHNFSSGPGSFLG